MKSFTWFAPPNRRLSSKADLTAPPTAPGPADEPEVVRFWECGSEMKQDWSGLPAYSVGPSSQWCLPRPSPAWLQGKELWQHGDGQVVSFQLRIEPLFSLDAVLQFLFFFFQRLVFFSSVPCSPSSVPYFPSSLPFFVIKYDHFLFVAFLTDVDGCIILFFYRCLVRILPLDVRKGRYLENPPWIF